MKNFSRQNQDDLDMEQLYEGMKAASEGPSKTSFVAGYQLMQNLKQQGAELKLKNIFEGMKSASAGKELEMSEEEIRAMMTSYSKLVEKRQMEKLKQQSDANVAEAEAYMSKNAADNPSVKTLDNGVQYEVLVEGDGAIPTAESKVKVDYHGMFLDGTVFDSSIKPPSGAPPKPAEMLAVDFVPGFSKVLQSMKVGSKWRVVIPGTEAYKMAGRGPIGPNQALIFEVTLLGILE
jgi:FKBP-type peptidyl-prolyl cis-trans isomerase FklB